MSGMSWEQEEQIIKALNALRKEKYSSVCAAALALGITPRTLLRRSKRSTSKNTRPPTSRTLAEEQERQLNKLLQGHDRTGCTPFELIIECTLLNQVKSFH